VFTVLPRYEEERASYFPLLIRYLDDGSYCVVSSPDTIEAGRAHHVIQTRVRVK